MSPRIILMAPNNHRHVIEELKVQHNDTIPVLINAIATQCCVPEDLKIHLNGAFTDTPTVEIQYNEIATCWSVKKITNRGGGHGIRHQTATEKFAAHVPEGERVQLFINIQTQQEETKRQLAIAKEETKRQIHAQDEETKRAMITALSAVITSTTSIDSNKRNQVIDRLLCENAPPPHRVAATRRATSGGICLDL